MVNVGWPLQTESQHPSELQGVVVATYILYDVPSVTYIPLAPHPSISYALVSSIGLPRPLCFSGKSGN